MCEQIAMAVATEIPISARLALLNPSLSDKGVIWQPRCQLATFPPPLFSRSSPLERSPCVGSLADLASISRDLWIHGDETAPFRAQIRVWDYHPQPKGGDRIVLMVTHPKSLSVIEQLHEGLSAHFDISSQGNIFPLLSQLFEPRRSHWTTA